MSFLEWFISFRGLGPRRGGEIMKKTVLVSCVVAVLVLALVLPRPQPAQAGSQGATATTIATWGGGLAAGAILAYVAWVNRPNNPNPPDWSRKGPGGFFIGGFLGGSRSERHRKWHWRQCLRRDAKRILPV